MSNCGDIVVVKSVELEEQELRGKHACGGDFMEREGSGHLDDIVRLLHSYPLKISTSPIEK